MAGMCLGGLLALLVLVAVVVPVAPLSAAVTGGGIGPESTPIGCTSSDSTVSQGPSGRRAVALTFDDGPKPRPTSAILATLERLDARATFFVEGRHVRGNAALLREMLASGSEIANHSYSHPKRPDRAELAATDRAIEAATRFLPCLFRPPYGLLDPAVEAAARDERLQTVLWSLDPGDDHHRGVGAIEAHAVRRARPGSIVLMHDGGRHPQTVAALAGIVEGLRARHFRLLTVTELLGGHFRFRDEGAPHG
ncbi:MAG: polysaccharide deacetylase family protein [Solirubrobacterales bacterium]